MERSSLAKFIMRDENGGGGSEACRAMSGEESSDDRSESVSLTKQDESCKGDKHASAEKLFRRMAGIVGLDAEAVNNVIESETGRNIEQRTNMEAEEGRKGSTGREEEIKNPHGNSTQFVL
ncbi:MAG: hypothetical protein EZS28_010961 [Streblomastix strix]|uniref:Uncharacterized protein n=1 Tax=Streblomastix strix TaxID=222440 RepID=A0A5J4WGT1_9EUKA|nr:MAG: hypothetical protein EZS28_010961 [Streblomastix strix]